MLQSPVVCVTPNMLLVVLMSSAQQADFEQCMVELYKRESKYQGWQARNIESTLFLIYLF